LVGLDLTPAVRLDQNVLLKGAVQNFGGSSISSGEEKNINPHQSTSIHIDPHQSTSIHIQKLGLWLALGHNV